MTNLAARQLLADIIWLIRGYLIAARDEDTMDIRPEHVEALRIAMEKLEEEERKA